MAPQDIMGAQVIVGLGASADLKDTMGKEAQMESVGIRGIKGAEGILAPPAHRVQAVRILEPSVLQISMH